MPCRAVEGHGALANYEFRHGGGGGVCVVAEEKGDMDCICGHGVGDEEAGGVAGEVKKLDVRPNGLWGRGVEEVEFWRERGEKARRRAKDGDSRLRFLVGEGHRDDVWAGLVGVGPRCDEVPGAGKPGAREARD